DHLDALELAHGVAVEHPLVEVKLVDETGTAARLHGDPQPQVVAAFLFQQGLDLAGGDIGQGDFVAELLSGGGGLRHLNLRGSFPPADQCLRPVRQPCGWAGAHRPVALTSASVRYCAQLFTLWSARFPRAVSGLEEGAAWVPGILASITG